MKFECPHCHRHLDGTPSMIGEKLPCPACGKDMRISDPQRTMVAEGASPSAVPEAIPVVPVPAGGQLAEMTISSFLASKHLEGRGVDLENSAGIGLKATGTEKYEEGEVVGEGGMGVVVKARDVNLRRTVAMKVLRNPQEADRGDILRFIEEAQVTSQLAHPSVVPVHELALDSVGQVFYTMKLVEGQSLKAILKGIANGDAKLAEEYSLSRLLGIFQKICDAMAFAHSKRVIHRDLKPDNVMVGEFGEVLVMDWGLAKILPKTKKKHLVPKGQAPAPGQKPAYGVESVRRDEGQGMLTMNGTIMGTPGFMAPEQALGEIESLDERTDIYALGAILYNILTLKIPISGATVDEMLEKTTTGDITPPTKYNTKRGSGKRDTGSRGRGEGGAAIGTRGQGEGGRGAKGVEFPHLPDGWVPESLSAVTMKALALKPNDRYASVQALQKEIESYQNGFATGAEKASAWRQISLLVKRHKGLSISVGVILALIVLGSGVSTRLWLRAETQKKVAVAEKLKAQEALKALRGTAPALLAQARTLLERNQLQEALQIVSYAIELVPENAEYWCQKGNLLQTLLQLDSAIEMYTQALTRDPQNKLAKINLDLSRVLLKEKADSQNKWSFSCILKLYQAMREQGRFTEAMNTMQLLAKDGKTIEDYIKSEVKKSGWNGTLTVVVKRDGACDVTIDARSMTVPFLQGFPIRSLQVGAGGGSCKISDLAPVQGLLLTSLALWNTQVRDLVPLTGMPLTRVNIQNSPVNDLAPLKGMSLTSLQLNVVPVTDLSPLKGMPLTTLNLSQTPVADISPLKGMPLTTLNLSQTSVNDLSPLKGMPLKVLSVNNGVTNLLPLAGMTLTVFYFNPSQNTITHGMDVIRNMKTLSSIGVAGMNMKPAEFWKKYDAGEFREK